MKDEKLLEKALSLFPTLYETRVEPAATVSPVRDDAGRVRMEQTEDFRLRRLKKGDRLVLDFGDHQVGYLSLQLGVRGSHADAPVWLRFHFAEYAAELFEDPTAYHGWICSSWVQTEQVHVDVLPSVIKLPRRYAFRYVSIEVLDISSKFDLTIEGALCRAVSSADDRVLVPYQAPDEMSRKLDATACRTLHNCMQTVFEDGPKRDRRLWMGDLRIQARVNYETYRQNDLVKECLYLFAALPAENGQVAACLFLEPEPEADDTVMLDYSLFFPAALLDYYKATGDRETLQELWPTALSQLYLAEARLTERDLIPDEDRMGWCFVDWNLALNKQGAAHGIFLYALRCGVETAGILGLEAEAQRLQELYETCRKAANTLLWDEESACYVSGKDRQISVATQVWMVLGGALEGKAAADLLKRTASNPAAVSMVSPYMMHNYIDALIAAGETEPAMQQMTAYWGGMLEAGADTFWELYNPDNPEESPYGGTIVNSYCHAWSCGPAYFLRKYQ